MITLLFLLMFAGGDIDTVKFEKQKFTTMEECHAAGEKLVPQMFEVLNANGTPVPGINVLCVRNKYGTRGA